MGLLSAEPASVDLDPTTLDVAPAYERCLPTCTAVLKWLPAVATPLRYGQEREHKRGNIEKTEAPNQRREQCQEEKQGGTERRGAVGPPEQEASAEEAKKNRPPVQGIQTDVPDKHNHEKKAGNTSGQYAGHHSGDCHRSSLRSSPGHPCLQSASYSRDPAC